MSTQLYSLHLGVSFVDTHHYGQRLMPLPCCRTDAEKMYQLMGLLQYDQRVILLDEDATTTNFTNQLYAWSKELKAGDILTITYSGHGSQVEDLNRDEESGEDQTWCLFDRMLIDDELRYVWREFAEDVNIFILLDSCHSGTGAKVAEPTAVSDLEKRMTFKESEGVWKGNWNEIYADVTARHEAVVPLGAIKASVLSISACKDNQVAKPGPFLSEFTYRILETLNDFEKLASYPALYRALLDMAPTAQTPHLDRFGSGGEYYLNARPFLRIGETFPEDFSQQLFKLKYTNALAETNLNRGILVDIADQDADAKSVYRSAPNESLEDIGANEIAIETIDHKGIQAPWDEAYDYYLKGREAGVSCFCEPAFFQEPEMEATKSAPTKPKTNEFLKNWPAPNDDPNPFLWHLGDDFSQLAKARKKVMEAVPADRRLIRIAHIDTGYLPQHIAAQGLKVVGPRSFMRGESATNPGVDILRSSKLAEQDFHGCATLAILAGQDIPAEYGYEGFPGGTMGAVPFAEIVPIRISETVALTGLLGNTKEFTKAIYYAIEMGCEVISMSMAGSPSRSWAKAINAAYDAGITIVTAAGNSWVKGGRRMLPKKILYPARFDRVIAATGVCYNQQPYIFSVNKHGETKTAGGEHMQGNHLPLRAMKTAIAAYTPNLPWAELTDKDESVFRKSGGGTSSATPQVAAAAALWIVQNREALDELVAKGKPWMKVEAVKHALFSRADKSHPLFHHYYGQGVLKAYDALLEPVPVPTQLKKAPKARVSWLGLAELTKLLILRKSDSTTELAVDDTLGEMLSLEILQILHKDPQLFHYLDHLDFEQEGPVFENAAQLRNFLAEVKESEFASQTLRNLKVME